MNEADVLTGKRDGVRDVVVDKLSPNWRQSGQKAVGALLRRVDRVHHFLDAGQCAARDARSHFADACELNKV